MNDGAGLAAPGATAGSGRPRLTAALAADLNRIYDRGAGIGLQRARPRARALLRPGPAAALRRPLSLALVVDGVPLAVGLDDFFLARALEPLLPDAALASAPPALRAAAIEVALAELAQAFEAATGRKVAVAPAEAAEARGAGGAEGRTTIGFVLREPGGADRARGRLAADARGVALVAALLADRPAPPREVPDALPLPVRLEIGTTRLPLAELAGLEPADIVLVERSFLSADDSLILRLAPRLAWKARIEGAAVIVTEQVKDIMAQGPAEAPGPEPGAKAGGKPPEKQAEKQAEKAAAAAKPPEKAADKTAEKAPEKTAAKPAEAPAASLDEVEIDLVFELGGATLTLAEIRAIGKGHVFDLGKDWRHAVTIRANGRVVGSGELIEVEDRLGVRVIELAGRGA
ncbi:MAG: type III secretion system cytoplasmic ring protein SctQ [Dongiaceae bacterium]